MTHYQSQFEPNGQNPEKLEDAEIDDKSRLHRVANSIAKTVRGMLETPTHRQMWEPTHDKISPATDKVHTEDSGDPEIY